MAPLRTPRKTSTAPTGAVEEACCRSTSASTTKLRPERTSPEEAPRAARSRWPNTTLTSCSRKGIRRRCAWIRIRDFEPSQPLPGCAWLEDRLDSSTDAGLSAMKRGAGKANRAKRCQASQTCLDAFKSAGSAAITGWTTGCAPGFIRCSSSGLTHSSAWMDTWRPSERGVLRGTCRCPAAPLVAIPTPGVVWATSGRRLAPLVHIADRSPAVRRLGRPGVPRTRPRPTRRLVRRRCARRRPTYIHARRAPPARPPPQHWPRPANRARSAVARHTESEMPQLPPRRAPLAAARLRPAHHSKWRHVSGLHGASEAKKTMCGCCC